MFHVNNFQSGLHGPYVWHMSNHPISKPEPSGVYFMRYQGTSDNDMAELDEENIVNGPIAKLLNVEFQFKFHGFLSATRVRIDFIRQRRIATDPWNPNKEKQFLPHTMDGFKRIAGFDPNEIDKKCFQIIKTKYLYINSDNRWSIQDLASGQDEPTVRSTTDGTKYCKVFLRMNEVARQLHSSLKQTDATDNVGQSVEDDDHPHGSSWSFTNQNPFKNVFCLISCDDPRHMSDAITGKNVMVEIIRKCRWRDPKA